MKISTSKWFLIFIYLIISFPVGVFVAVVIAHFLIEIVLFLIFGQPFYLYEIDFMKILKGSIVGGLIGAIGCWWIYYQGYKKNRNR